MTSFDSQRESMLGLPGHCALTDGGHPFAEHDSTDPLTWPHTDPVCHTSRQPMKPVLVNANNCQLTNQVLMSDELVSATVD